MPMLHLSKIVIYSEVLQMRFLLFLLCTAANLEWNNDYKDEVPIVNSKGVHIYITVRLIAT